MMADLSNLPEIDFISVDAEKITNDIITVYEGLADRKLYPADPIRLFLTALAQLIIQQRVLINETGKQNLLRYASGDVLDHMGARSNVPRLEAMASRAIQQYNLSVPLTTVTIIPAGNRVGPAGASGLYFETVNTLEIPAGALFGVVEVVCTTPGTSGDGFLPGQINNLIDPIPFVQSVMNTTVSTGGAERETDDAYRERIRLAPESFSTAGPDGAYRYWAMTANPSIVDVSVSSPSPCNIEIRPLLKNGEIPTQEILNQVLAVCNDKKIRPLGDRIQALAPEQVSYDLNVTYWIGTSNSSVAGTIQKQVEQAISDYRLWQKSKLGRDIDPSELTTRIKNAGAKRAAVTLPVSQQIQSFQVAKDAQVTITYGGLEDD